MVPDIGSSGLLRFRITTSGLSVLKHIRQTNLVALAGSGDQARHDHDIEHYFCLPLVASPLAGAAPGACLADFGLDFSLRCCLLAISYTFVLILFNAFDRIVLLAHDFIDGCARANNPCTKKRGAKRIS